MRIGVLTGGGDCPGLNAVIRAVVMTGHSVYGDHFVGFLDGWRGAIEERTILLDPSNCRDIIAQGGTILGTSRTNPFGSEDGARRVCENLKSHGVDALIVIGGDDTLGVAGRLGAFDVKAVGVPKTIDNDLAGTEYTFGFTTAVQTATDAIDRLRTTAESHHRIIVCEVMGRNAGWIATHAGIAGGATEILVPEEPFDLDTVCRRITARHERGQYSSIIVVSEGASPAPGPDALAFRSSIAATSNDDFGHPRLGGIGAWLGPEIERRTGYETRVTALGHVQRGGSPTAFDRVLATRFGVAAIAAVHDNSFGSMVALQAGQIVLVPMSDAARQPKYLDLGLLHNVALPATG